jgi:hypothetical protein
MQEFSVEGRWWLPETADRRVPGRLTCDADGPELLVDEPLRPFTTPSGGAVPIAWPEYTVIPVVHGRTRDGGNVTLLNAGGANLAGPFGGQEAYRADVALVGQHITTDTFGKAWAEFDWLDAWLDPPLVLTRLDNGGVPAPGGRLELATAKAGDDTLKLVSGLAGTVQESSLHLDRWSALVAELAAPLGWRKIVEDRVRPFHDLLITALGRPMRLTGIRLRPTGPGTTLVACDAHFSVIQQPPATVPSARALRGQNTMTLLTGRELTGPDATVPAGSLLEKWSALWERDRNALGLLLASYHAAFMYDDHKFASTFQAVEALHRTRFPGQEKDNRAHDARVAAIITAATQAGVGEQTAGWAGRVLKSRNDKPLWLRIEDVVRSTGAAGNAVLNADPDFAKTVASARTGVSRGGAARNLDALDRYWYREVLQWIARVRVLTDAGVSDAANRAINRSSFQHALKQIDAAGH